MSNVTSIQQIDAPTLMAEIKASIDSTAGMLRALALGGRKRADDEEQHPGMCGELGTGHMEAAAAYLAEELALASQFAALLLKVDGGEGSQAIDTGPLSTMQRRRLASLTTHRTCQDAGEALAAHLSGVAGMLLWLSTNIEHISGLDPRGPAVILIRQRVEAIEAHADLWVATTMPRKRESQFA